MERIHPYEDVPAFDSSTEALIAGFGGSGASAAARG
jgi:hypothetical protein